MIPHSAPWIGEEEVEAAARVLRSGHLAQGTEVEALERECAAFLGRRFAVAVNSGTSALHLALGAAGVVREDPVAMPSYACAALVTAARLQGACPRLCDVGDDYNLDPEAVPEEARAVVAPHLFGARAALPSATAVVEDIAQSMGGDTGRSSPMAVTSFYATKLMTTGEGGMVFTDDESTAAYVRDRRDYDSRDDLVPRQNYKMTDLQAAVGRVQLTRLPDFIARRRALAARYLEAFRNLPLVLPNPTGHVFFRFVVAAEERESLERHLRSQGVDAKRPVHRPAHHYLGGDYPNSERAHKQCLSLPIHPSLQDGDVERVIESVQRFWG